jgi:hypothetical protein
MEFVCLFKGNENNELGTGFCVGKRILLVVKWVKFVGNHACFFNLELHGRPH